ncbi:hypothetical protein [Kineosporia succinea]|uniref:Uncharacterized protein n=1 Tax=Kineosporia succinea TaxID=84632 RepID=A0ABT9P5U5_9ACTN|nr:hypothetical protein [Kineosporia succinea]MDP9828066.1 hypothetical protein [Kineosporia succinea]
MSDVITDQIRAGVLGAIGRGMSKSYAARADGISVADVEVLIAEAGGLDAVLARYAPHRVVEGPRPCRVCGVPVTAEYITRTGNDWHGHHPAPRPRIEL